MLGSVIPLLEVALDGALLKFLLDEVHDPLCHAVFERINNDESRHLAVDFHVLGRPGRRASAATRLPTPWRSCSPIPGMLTAVPIAIPLFTKMRNNIVDMGLDEAQLYAAIERYGQLASRTGDAADNPTFRVLRDYGAQVVDEDSWLQQLAQMLDHAHRPHPDPRHSGGRRPGPTSSPTSRWHERRHDHPRSSLRGLDDFAGTIMTGAMWSSPASTTSMARRVALVGDPAMSPGLVGRLARRAALLKVFQSDPVWVLPRLAAPARRSPGRPAIVPRASAGGSTVRSRRAISNAGVGDAWTRRQLTPTHPPSPRQCRLQQLATTARSAATTSSSSPGRSPAWSRRASAPPTGSNTTSTSSSSSDVTGRWKPRPGRRPAPVGPRSGGRTAPLSTRSGNGRGGWGAKRSQDDHQSPNLAAPELTER